ncbi:hypothetical protein LSTR_LSTR017576 [Laodelphax striatellus]|uniref:Uncharacterized protein n=1 Tax=Laodelphax striatellus TaxID=195883 RepID=A0A482WSA8_LAOST|nr:hypothetical protein LSTR_LSTR008829 [Laodelphax striatellus]RZF37858.1 hypothetical protein LSTR_LSTR017576 [Laodelphax striatellus]
MRAVCIGRNDEHNEPPRRWHKIAFKLPPNWIICLLAAHAMPTANQRYSKGFQLLTAAYWHGKLRRIQHQTTFSSCESLCDISKLI